MDEQTDGNWTSWWRAERSVQRFTILLSPEKAHQFRELARQWLDGDLVGGGRHLALALLLIISIPLAKERGYFLSLSHMKTLLER